MKDRLSEYVDRVEREHERVVVTRNGRPAIVLISTDDLASLEDTISLLSDPDAVRALHDADAAVATGEVVRGVDAVRGLRLPRRLGDVMADVANYTNITSVMQVSEIVI